MKKTLITLILSVLTLTACAAIREETSQFQYTGITAFSNAVRFGYYDTNVVFNTNNFPVKFAITTKDGMILPAGTTLERPSGGVSDYPTLRYNSDVGMLEYKYNGGIWNIISTGTNFNYNAITNPPDLSVYATTVSVAQVESNLTGVGTSLTNTQGDVSALIGNISNSYVVVNGVKFIKSVTPSPHADGIMWSIDGMGSIPYISSDPFNNIWRYEGDTEHLSAPLIGNIPPQTGWLDSTGGVANITVEFHQGTIADEESARIAADGLISTNLTAVSNKADSAYSNSTNALAQIITETNRAIQADNGLGLSLTNTQGDVSALIGNITNSYVMVNGEKYSFILMGVTGRPNYEESVYPSTLAFTAGHWLISSSSEYTNSSTSYIPPPTGWLDSTGGVANITVEFHQGTIADEEAERISSDALKADITGSNITNPAAFRTAIGAVGTNQIVQTLSSDSSNEIPSVAAVNDGLAGKSDKARNTFVLLGDSLTGISTLEFPTTEANVIYQNGISWVNWMRSFLPSQIEIIANEATGGWTTSNMLADIDAAVSTDADYAIICGGRNDVSRPLTSGETISNLTSIITQLEASGKQVFLMTVTAVTTVETEYQQIMLERINRWICEEAPVIFHNVTAIDIWPVLASYTTSAYVTTNVSYDHGTHWASQSAMLVGKKVADEIAKVLPPSPIVFPSNISKLNLFPIAAFTNAADATLSTNCTASIVADSTYLGKSNLVVTVSNGTLTVNYARYSFTPASMGYGVDTTNRIYAIADISWDVTDQAGIDSVFGPYLWLRNDSSTNTPKNAYANLTLSSTRSVPDVVLKTGRCILRTPAMQATGLGSYLLYFNFGGISNGTFTVHRAAILEE